MLNLLMRAQPLLNNLTNPRVLSFILVLQLTLLFRKMAPTCITNANNLESLYPTRQLFKR